MMNEYIGTVVLLGLGIVVTYYQSQWYKYDPDKSEDIVINTSDGLEVVNVPKDADNIHQKMYEIATSKYNPFSVGGSESIHDFEGGSENVMS